MVGEDDLVLSVDGVLIGVMTRGDSSVFGVKLCTLCSVQVRGTQRTGGNVDVIYMVENHRTVCAGEGEIVF